MGRVAIGKWLGVAALAVVLLGAASGPASACCCTCENSVKCFPGCLPDIVDRASCEGACLDAECGHSAPCPDPAGGLGCNPGEVSCLDVGPGVVAPVPALAAGGLIVAVLLLGGVAYVMLLRPRR